MKNVSSTTLVPSCREEKWNRPANNVQAQPSIHIVDNEWIPMPDGERLAARIWLPGNAEAHPAPALLDVIPYRKSDCTVVRDATVHGYFAARGYACVRVDVRGSGDSAGVLTDCHTDEQCDDVIAVIDWLADQPWCNGRVGMLGLSWGGITALKVAARKPAHLATVLTVCACEDSMLDDAGYFPGCLYDQAIGWAAVLFGFSTRPPNPDIVGNRWRELWLQRLQETPFYLEQWLQAKSVDSARAVAAAIEIPVYSVGGFADSWPNTPTRLLAQSSAPRKALIGPWAHGFPHFVAPGPRIGFLQEAVRWFDHWLKDNDTGILHEPPYRAFMQESVLPKPFYAQRPGRWVTEPTLPSSRIETRRFFLDAGTLADERGEEQQLPISSPQTVGLASGEYMPWFLCGPAPELPGDQRMDDMGSLTFDSDVLEQRLEVLGRAQLEVELASDRPLALVAVRLCDVAPGGESTLVSRAIVNLANRNGKDNEALLEPGRRYRVSIALNEAAYAFAPAHRLRIALSTSYWPMAWPAPQPVTLTVFTGASHIDIPVRPLSVPDDVPADFASPETASPPSITLLRSQHARRTQRTDIATGVTEYLIDHDCGRWRINDTGLEFGSRCAQRYTIDENDPLSARAAYCWHWEHGRGKWQVSTRSRLLFRATANAFIADGELDAWEGESRIVSRSWHKRFVRDYF